MRRVCLLAACLAGLPLPAAALKGFAPAKEPPPPKTLHRPVVVMPEGFVGREKEVLTLLFPEGISDKAEADGARLREARRWVSDGKTFLSVLVDRWSAPLCETLTCTPQPTELAVLELRGKVLGIVGRMPSVGHHGGNATVLFDPETRRLDPQTTVLGVREETVTDGRRESTLRLFHVGSGELHGVFERRLEAAEVVPKGHKPSGCTATIRSDEFGTPPWAMKVSEHCTQTGKGSTELWRWNGTSYRIHGPPSHAEQSDAEFITHVDEAVR